MFRSIQRQLVSSKSLKYGSSSCSFIGISNFRGIHYSLNPQALSKFSMPAMSPTMTEGGISSWKKKEGDTFSSGDVLLEIETDKATMDVEAQEDGKIAKIIVGDGSKSVPVGKAIAIMAEEGEEIDSGELDKLIAESDAASSAPPSKNEEPQVSPAKTQSPTKTDRSSSSPSPSARPPRNAPREVIFATPAAKRLALEKGIALGSIKGSGPNGRILESDLSSHAKVQAPESSLHRLPPYDDIPVSNMRRTIAERLTASKRDIPHYQLTSEIHMDRLKRLREIFNQAAEQPTSFRNTPGMKPPTKLSVNDFVIKASALACADVPEVNSAWHDDYIRRYRVVDISVAVATPTGLITPIVTDVGSRGVGSISAEVKLLAAKAKSGQLMPSEYQGGTFTVSNLGMFGSVSQFSAIINPPQACILAVGGAEKKVVLDDSSEDGDPKGFKEVEVMKVSLCCDHRVVDGVVGARWLRSFKTYMENPLSFML